MKIEEVGKGGVRGRVRSGRLFLGMRGMAEERNTVGWRGGAERRFPDQRGDQRKGGVEDGIGRRAVGGGWGGHGEEARVAIRGPFRVSWRLRE